MMAINDSQPTVWMKPGNPGNFLIVIQPFELRQIEWVNLTSVIPW